MGTRIKKQQLYINAELTDIGQKYLASGRLSIEGAAVLDNEIDYRFGEFGDSYDIRSNYVLKMQREQSRRVFYNLDGTTPLPVTNVFSGFRQITANTGSVGVFSATSANPSIDDYIFNREVWVASAETSQGETLGNPTSGGDPNRIESLINIYGDIPEEGVVVVQFFAYSNSGTNFSNISNYAKTENINLPFQYLTYQYSSITTTSIEVKHPLPQGMGRNYYMFFYPLSGQTYYGSSTTVDSKIWNLNIVNRRNTQMTPEISGESAYKLFGSRNYSGTLHALDVDPLLRSVAFIHKSNSFTGNTLMDQFLPNTTTVDMPTIMWHRNSTNVNGCSFTSGLRLSDVESGILYDASANTNYTLLKDSTGYDIGRVYFNLKFILITDPELITVMQYASNRNWTLPPLKTEFIQRDPDLTPLGRTGVISDDYNYYLTYSTQSYIPSGSGDTIPMRAGAPCSYIKKIEGTSENGSNLFLKAFFEPNSFPYLRAKNLQYNFEDFSGTGWSSHYVGLRIQRVDKESEKNDLDIYPFSSSSSSYGWKRVDNSSTTTTSYSEFGFGDISDSTNPISPNELNSKVFSLSLEGFNDMVPINESLEHQGASYLDYLETPGSEEIFFGNVSTTVAKNIHTKVVDLLIQDIVFHTTNNFTYQDLGIIYITEICLLNELNEVVAVAKPDRPIKKSQQDMIQIFIEIDY